MQDALGTVIVLKGGSDNQNLSHTSPFQMAITLEIQGFVEAYLGLLFFGYLLYIIVVHGHTSVEEPGQASPFCKLGICARVSVQGVGRDK